MNHQDDQPRAPRLRLFFAIGLGVVSIAVSVVLVVADVVGRGSQWAGHPGVSAAPLLLVAGAITAFSIARPASRREDAMRLVAAAAFVAWGLSQLAHSPQLAGVLDDLAILLFVIDAGFAVVPQARARLASAPAVREASEDQVAVCTE